MSDGAKVCILNDTSEWYHWGCHGTSVGLSGLIDRMLKPCGVAALPFGLTYQNPEMPLNVEALRNPRATIEFLKTWPAAMSCWRPATS